MKTETSKLLYFIIGLVLLISITPILILFFFFHSYKISDDLNDWSDFGSFVGGTSAAITISISIILLLYTLLSQKRVESIAFESFINQKFERRFFELFNVFNEYRFRQLTIITSKETYTGLRTFIALRLALLHHKQGGKSVQESIYETIKFREDKMEFYFICLNNLLSTLDEIELETDKYKLVKLVSDSLSNDEKFFIKYLEYVPEFNNLDAINTYKNQLIENIYMDYWNELG